MVRERRLPGSGRGHQPHPGLSPNPCLQRPMGAKDRGVRRPIPPNAERTHRKPVKALVNKVIFLKTSGHNSPREPISFCFATAANCIITSASFIPQERLRDPQHHSLYPTPKIPKPAKKHSLKNSFRAFAVIHDESRSHSTYPHHIPDTRRRRHIPSPTPPSIILYCFESRVIPHGRQGGLLFICFWRGRLE